MDLTSSWLLLVVGVVSCIFLISTWKKMYGRGGRLPPGPTPFPLIGNILQMELGQTAKSLLKLRDKYGPVFTIYLGSQPHVVLCGYDAVKEALVDHADEFSGRGTWPSADRVLGDYGIVLSNGERWKQMRRFSLMTLRNFGMGKRSIEERIQEEAQFLLEDIRQKKGLPFNPNMTFNLAVANVICSVTFHERFEYDDAKFRYLLQLFNDVFESISSTAGQLYEVFPSIMRYVPGKHQKMFTLMGDLMKFIAERVKMSKESFDPDSVRDYIDCFLKKMAQDKNNPSSEFNMKNLLACIENVFFAGTETVATTLRYGFLIFLKHPQITEKLHEEIDRVIGRNRYPCMEDRSKMPYMDAVIHEVQRYSDLIPMNLTHSVTKDTEFRGFMLPKGINVIPMLSSVLRDPTQFENPDTFNPGRFLDENGGFKKHDAFMPFSAGKRVCMGEGLARMELFLFFCNILQNLSVQAPVDMTNFDISPRMTGFANQPPPYKLSLIER